MTYEEAREYITKCNQYGNELSLEAIKELLNRLGNPQDKIKVIHVAGTNGKGSTTAFLASILACAGYRVGRYISPAVFDYLERVQISKRIEASRDIHTKGIQNSTIVTNFITKSGFSDTVTQIKKVCDEMLQIGLPHPTPFEIETAMAFLYLYQENVDFAIIEVGLGGRLDATNVMKKPICCIITSISMDHMQYLGDTLGKIAGEKAGIIKEGTSVITNNSCSDVLSVLEQVCQDKNAILSVVDSSKARIISTNPDGTILEYNQQDYSISMLGEYQVSNATLAIEAARILQRLGYQIEEKAMKEGLQQARWRGRFEIIQKEPYLVIDGAHNADAALQLRKSIERYFHKQKKIFIIGVLGDKDYGSILELTAPLAETIITITPNNDRALASANLAAEAKKYCMGNIIDASTVENALKLAYEEATAQDVIIAFGSLSFLGELCDKLIS
jgi:dihydrofolate synthase/folylpolyglutamate synthase